MKVGSKLVLPPEPQYKGFYTRHHLRIRQINGSNGSLVWEDNIVGNPDFVVRYSPRIGMIVHKGGRSASTMKGRLEDKSLRTSWILI